MHSTNNIVQTERADFWNDVIAETYFPLQLTFSNAATFEGKLEHQSLGEIELSRLQTGPIQYERKRHQIVNSTEEQYLITIPSRSPVDFYQLGRQVRCNPGGFILERGDEPYQFSYAAKNDLVVIKVSKQLLADQLPEPDRFCAEIFDGKEGLGGLFTTMALRVQSYAPADKKSRLVLGRNLIDLLALVLGENTQTNLASRSSVRAAHLQRAEEFIATNLANSNLSPDLVANSCGISKRYLHEVYENANQTVSQSIRQQRLNAARNALTMQNSASMSEIAYRFGFSDQAQFSRSFRGMFGQTPSEYRQIFH